MTIANITPRMLLLLWIVAALAEYSLGHVQLQRFSDSAAVFLARMHHERVQELEARRAVDSTFNARLDANPRDSAASHLFELVKRSRFRTPVVVTDKVLQSARDAAAQVGPGAPTTSLEGTRRATRQLFLAQLLGACMLAVLPIVMILGTGYWWGVRHSTVGTPTLA